MSDGARELVRAFIAGLTPPPRLTVAEWADAHRLLGSFSAEPGPYRTDRTPYAREPMERLSSSDRCRTVILMWGAQTGKSEIGNNWMGYTIDHDPVPTILMQPTVETAQDYSRVRIDRMIADCPRLLEKCGPQKSRSGASTLGRKGFPGGFLKIVGSNAPAQLASTPAARAFVDEVDRCSTDAGGEGDSVALLRKRMRTFPRAKMLMTSTPTIKGASRVEAEFTRTGQRYYWVPCPHCGHMDRLTFERLTWTDGNPLTAHMVCGGCGGRIEDRHKATMLPGGEWRPEFPELETGDAYGYHLSSLYAPVGWSDASWPAIARDFMEAKDDPKLLKTFVNTTLAETWDEFQGDDFEDADLQARCERYAAEVPAGVAVLTAGADVQIDRIEVEVVGWGPGEESWSIDYAVLPGDPTGSEIWDDLAAYLSQPWEHETAGVMRVSAAAIDCGYETRRVQDFCAVHRRRRWYAVKGLAGDGKPMWPRRAKTGQKNQGGVYFSVGVDTAKTVNWRRLQRIDPGPGMLHFPEGRDLVWFQQLVAEVPRMTHHRGRPKRLWVPRGGARSEALDCRVYAMCVLYAILTPVRTLERLHDDLPVVPVAERRRAIVEARAQAEVSSVAQRAQPKAKRPRSDRKRRRRFEPRF